MGKAEVFFLRGRHGFGLYRRQQVGAELKARFGESHLLGGLVQRVEEKKASDLCEVETGALEHCGRGFGSVQLGLAQASGPSA